MTTPNERPTVGDRTGSRVGDYILEGEIGRGGMGVVYKAHRTDTGQIVALKLMLPELSSNPRFRERFVMEATLAPALDHPNIVPAYETGDANGELFIAMKLVEGQDLKALIEGEGPLDPKRTLSILRQVASALDAAHEAGVVHRDVKPQNILIAHGEDQDKELVFVTDFGLVKPVGSESTASRTGQILGSIQYMSPEQVEGISSDARSDVYALGCVLYECLTKKIPFDRPNEVAVLWAHVHEDPPRVTTSNPELPGGLDTVVANALQKHPDDRYLTCGELIDAFEQGLGKRHRPIVMPLMRPIVKRIPRKKTEREIWAPNFFPELSRVKRLADRTNWFRVIATTITLCLLAAGVLQFAHPRGLAGAVSDGVGAVGDIASQAGDALTSVNEGDEVVSSQPSSVPSPGDDRGPAAAGDFRESGRIGGPNSKDGIQSDRSGVGSSDSPEAAAPPGPSEPKIAWIRGNNTTGPSDYNDTDIWVMSPDGTQKTRLTNTTAPEFWPDWSPDGNHLVYVRRGELWMMNADGSDQQSLDLCASGYRCSDPSWAPDGRRIAFLEGNDDQIYSARVVIGRLADGERRIVPTFGAEDAGFVRGLRSVKGPSWSPDGKWLVGSCLHRGTYDACRVRLSDGKRRVVDGFYKTWNYAWSPTGQEIAMIRGEAFQPQKGVYLISIDGADGRYLTATRRATSLFQSEPSWSPDGSSLVYAEGHDTSDLVRIGRDGSGITPLTANTEPDIMPDWWGPSS